MSSRWFSCPRQVRDRTKTRTGHSRAGLGGNLVVQGAGLAAGGWSSSSPDLWAGPPFAPTPTLALFTAAEAGLQQRRVLALHLRRYNDALLIHDTVRAVDALASLQDFYNRERNTKSQILRAERWLLDLFDGEEPEKGPWGEPSFSSPNPQPWLLTGSFPHL